MAWIDQVADSGLLDELWPDSTRLSPGTLTVLLDAAQDQCEGFAAVLAVGDPVPARYKQAVVLQARANYEAARPDGQVGVEFVMESRTPLLKTIRNLLRPTTGKPVIW